MAFWAALLPFLKGIVGAGASTAGTAATAGGAAAGLGAGGAGTLGGMAGATGALGVPATIGGATTGAGAMAGAGGGAGLGTGMMGGLKGMLAERYGLTGGFPKTGKEWMSTLEGLGQMKSDIQGMFGGEQEGAMPAGATPGTPIQFGDESPLGFGGEGGYMGMLSQLGGLEGMPEEDIYGTSGYW